MRLEDPVPDGRPASAAVPPRRGHGARLSRSLSGTNLARAGDYNLRTVLQHVRLAPGTTRIDIARRTGLTAPTIANITGRLADMELVRVVGRTQGRRGQPALQLEVNPDGAFGIGVNIDRDHLTMVTLDLAGTVRSRVTREVAFALPEEARRFVHDELPALLRRGAVDRARVLGVGVAIPDELGRIALPGRPDAYRAWNEVTATALLRDLPWPVHCDNDAAAAALGEAEFGTAFANPSFFYLLISAGLGGGLVIDRSYHRGADNRSGEIGLMPDPGAAAPDATVQDTVSVSALLRRLEAAGLPAGIADLRGDGSADGPAAAVVERWLADAVRSLAAPLAAVTLLLNPHAILIGGRLPMPLIERLAAALSDRLDGLALPAPARIMAAMMAQDAPAIGAAILPFLDELLPSDAILIQAGR